jgi:hypothetical protein
VQARSYAVRARAHVPVRTGPTPVATPLPASLTRLAWKLGDVLPQEKRLTMTLTNVGRVAVAMDRAGLRCGRVVVRTDGPTTLRLTGLPGRDRTYPLDAGRRVLRLSC